MKVVNEVTPADIETLQQRLASGAQGAVVMVNLLKFKDVAEYPDGRECVLTGADAYDKYMDAVRKVLPEIGARVVYEGSIGFLALGQVEEPWDKVLLIEYPSLAALAALGTYEVVQAALTHRQAGLAGQLLMEATGPA